MRKTLAALVGACATLCAGQASAAIVTVSYSGTASGYDGAGLFGGPVDYLNENFQAAYRFDESDAYPGEPGGDFGSFLGVDITLAGFSWSLPNSPLVQVGDAAIEGVLRASGAFVFNWVSPGERTFLQLGHSIFTSSAPAERTEAFVGTGSNTSGYRNSLDYYVKTPGMAEKHSVFWFVTTGVQVTSIAGAPTTGAGVGWIPAHVPEPSTWAMLLMGFFGLGTALRLRRRLA